MENIEFSLSLNNRFAVDYNEYSLRDLVQLAREVDGSPLVAVWVGDSLFDSPRYDPVACLGMLAEATNEISIGTSILQPHLRNRVVTANSVATIDRLSHGRTILGVGIGGGTPGGIARECEEIGISPSERGSRLEQVVQDIRRLWSGDHPEIDLPIRPRRETVPVWIASGIYQPEREDVSAQSGSREHEGGQYVPGKLNRVARLGDGWFTVQARPEDMASSLKVIDDYREEYGRDSESFTSCVECWLRIGSDTDECLETLRHHIKQYFHGAPVDPETVTRWSIWGPPKQCKQQILSYRDAGVDQIKFKMAARNPRRQTEELLQFIS